MKHLKKLRAAHGYTQMEVAEMLGVQRPTYSRYESGERQPDYETLIKLSKIFGASIDYIVGKTDFSAEENRRICQNVIRLWETIENPPNPENIVDIVKPFQQIQKSEYQFTYEALDQFATYFGVGVDVLTAEPVSLQKAKGIKIPVLGQVAAGIPMEAIENIVDYEEISESMAAGGEYFGLKIKGSSMEPRIKEGDVVIVRQQPEVESGDVAIVMVNGECATCKKVLFANDGITLLPYNPVFEPMFYSSEQVNELPVRIIGKVVELRGKF